MIENLRQELDEAGDFNNLKSRLNNHIAHYQDSYHKIARKMKKINTELDDDWEIV